MCERWALSRRSMPEVREGHVIALLRVGSYNRSMAHRPLHAAGTVAFADPRLTRGAWGLGTRLTLRRHWAVAPAVAVTWPLGAYGNDRPSRPTVNA